MLKKKKYGADVNTALPHVPALTATTPWEQRHCKHLRPMAWVPRKQLSEHGRELEDHTAQPPHPSQVPQQDRVAATTSSSWKTPCPGYLPSPFLLPAWFPGITSHTNDLHSHLCRRGQRTPVYTMSFWARAAKIRKACPLKTVNLTGKPTFFFN